LGARRNQALWNIRIGAPSSIRYSPNAAAASTSDAQIM
jgi:hypothetical protein